MQGLFSGFEEENFSLFRNFVKKIKTSNFKKSFGQILLD